LESNNKITLSKRISGDQDGDATLFGSVLTNHASRAFEMTQSKDQNLRFASLELLSVLLRQGLVNPNETVPFLFALQGDVENATIRSLALKLLMTEGEKRPDMLRQRVCAGVKRAYEFQRNVYGKNAVVSAVVPIRHGKSVVMDCIFSSVYKECIASSRQQRHGLFSNLLRLFEISDQQASEGEAPKHRRLSRTKKVEPSSERDLHLLSFTSQILAHLPYNSSGDPLFIIHKITAIVTLQGIELLEKLASVLRPVGLASSDEDDETNFAEDELERAGRSKFPSRTREAQPLSSSEFDMVQFTRLCIDGLALTQLLRLKSYLRQLYNLSEIRCLEYDPSAKDRIADRGLSKSDSVKPFDAVIIGSDKRSGPSNKDWLIRQYAEFRRFMREENGGCDEENMVLDPEDNESESDPVSPKHSREEI